MLTASFSPEVTPDERLKLVAAILARGIRRYLRRLRRSETLAEKEVPEFSLNGLEVSADPRLSVSRCIGV